MFVGILKAEQAMPKFKWLSDQSSSNIPNLAIEMENEKHVAILHPYNPLSYEVKSTVDPCIFKGTLELEPTTEVLVTGGCPGSDTFDVSSVFSAQSFLTQKNTFDDRLTEWVGLVFTEFSWPITSSVREYW